MSQTETDLTRSFPAHGFLLPQLLGVVSLCLLVELAFMIWVKTCGSFHVLQMLKVANSQLGISNH